MNETSPAGPMKPRDLLLCLIGHRAAIERIAATKHAWIIGAILVLTAGIARNYDHLDLLTEPEWFIGPFVASLFSTVFIFAWAKVPLKFGKVGKEGPQLATFLTLFWLTAPCAWVYGIPVESFTDIITATKWNITFLAFVALWRVAIIVRAVSVLCEIPVIRVLPVILAPAALESWIGSVMKGMSLVGIMGGVRLPPHTEILAQASNVTATVSFILLIACIIGILITRGTAARPLSRPRSPLFAKSSLVISLILLACWIAITPPFQKLIRNRNHLFSLIEDDRFTEAVSFASSKQRSDFSAIHDLPPGRRISFPLPLLDALRDDSPVWLRTEWYDQALAAITHWGHFRMTEEQWRHLVQHHPLLVLMIHNHAEAIRKGEFNPPRFPHWSQSWLEDYDLKTSQGWPKD